MSGATGELWTGFRYEVMTEQFIKFTFSSQYVLFSMVLFTPTL